MSCKNCNSKNLKKIIHLGKQPISSHFYKKRKYNLKKYSLDLYMCKKCNLVQFKKIPKLDEMYGLNYGYRTSLSPLMIDHMKKKFKKIYKKSKKSKKILDIGCNDGTFLNFFAKKNYDLYGIDPSAKKFRKYHNKRIDLIIDYFNKEIIYKKFGEIKFDIITSFAMFYDIEDPNSFVSDINKLLTRNGKWILELSYFPTLLENLTYDQICHEHVTYYTLTSFENIIKKHNLKLVDCNLNNINGGSIEIVCCKNENTTKVNNEKINFFKNKEKKINYQSYKKFNRRISNIKKDVNNFLKKNNNTIGYGASTKGNIVLNHCKINKSNLKYICDANPYKYNRYTPGSNIKIISKNEMRKLRPKNLFVLIWSFRKEVIKQERDFIKKGGRLILHLPKLHIIDKNNCKDFENSNFEKLSYNI